MSFAAWWRRVVAAGLDLVVVAAPVGLVGSWFGLVETVRAADGRVQRYSAKPGLLVLSTLTYLVYSGLMDGAGRGATIGKMAMHIQVRDAAAGGAIGPARGLARRFIFVLLFNVFFVPGLVNILVPLIDQRRQGWHDKVANSVVVDAA